VDAEDKVDEVTGRENENGVCAGVELTYRGIVDCAVGRWEA
jgi:hypothetical protein